MARLARVVLPGVVHHVTQRGVRSMPIFQDDQDRETYLSLLRGQARKAKLRIVGYCLMDNHVHLLVIPRDQDSLRKGIAETHRLYTRYFNLKVNLRGHLFQGRFLSCPMDDQHYLEAARYVERNPVRAKLVKSAGKFAWSSARFHLGLTDSDPLIQKVYLRPNSLNEWSKWLRSEPKDLDNLRLFFRVGRPLGSAAFIQKAERVTKRELTPKKPGRPAKEK